MCVRACVRACMRVCVCVCARARARASGRACAPGGGMAGTMPWLTGLVTWVGRGLGRVGCFDPCSTRAVCSGPGIERVSTGGLTRGLAGISTRDSACGSDRIEQYWTSFGTVLDKLLGQYWTSFGPVLDKLLGQYSTSFWAQNSQIPPGLAFGEPGDSTDV